MSGSNDNYKKHDVLDLTMSGSNDNYKKHDGLECMRPKNIKIMKQLLQLHAQLYSTVMLVTISFSRYFTHFGRLFDVLIEISKYFNVQI